MQTIAVISQKGGSGKTTLAIHLCAEVAARGAKALLLDLDPQASAAEWGDRRGDQLPDIITEHPARIEAALKAAHAKGYEIVFLDTAPHSDQAALRAAKFADLVLVPCRPSALDLAAIRSTLDVADMAKSKAFVVLNAAPHHAKVVDGARAELVAGGSTVLPIVIRHRVAFQHCMADGRVAAEYEPGGQAATEITNLWEHVSALTS